MRIVTRCAPKANPLCQEEGATIGTRDLYLCGGSFVGPSWVGLHLLSGRIQSAACAAEPVLSETKDRAGAAEMVGVQVRDTLRRSHGDALCPKIVILGYRALPTSARDLEMAADVKGRCCDAADGDGFADRAVPQRRDHQAPMCGIDEPRFR